MEKPILNQEPNFNQTRADLMMFSCLRIISKERCFHLEVGLQKWKFCYHWNFFFNLEFFSEHKFFRTENKFLKNIISGGRKWVPEDLKRLPLTKTWIRFQTKKVTYQIFQAFVFQNFENFYSRIWLKLNILYPTNLEFC